MKSDSDTDASLQRQREIQREQDRRDERAARKGGGQGGDESAVQAGAREYPEQMPAQHVEKPGRESELALAPRFMAPDYRGSGKLDGFCALVTGGDSGIGRAVAVLFAREGADVAVAYHSSDDDADETRRCVEGEGRRCLLLKGDVKDDDWCRKAVQRSVNEFGRLDVLVNNAAFQEHAADITEIDDRRLFETLDTNFGGYFRMARAAVPHMKPGASIINTGSVVGLEGSGRLLDYSATKGAIHAFTKALAHNLLDRGIRVNAVAPGPVWTPLNPADKPAEQVAKFGQKTDMKRAAQPEELSPAYVFLAAPACAGYITGIVLPVTGSIGSI
jgi:NAD(P)-dependent dehydrogenase (short-subunit alcohol dehydrogenase family)